MAKGQQIRASTLFRNEIRLFKARCLQLGKVPPSDAKITDIIAKNVNLREILEDEYFKL